MIQVRIRKIKILILFCSLQYCPHQSKTLASDSGVIFSPPSIIREALDDSELYLHDDMICHREPSKVMTFELLILLL